jgi:hypothetical protein
LVTSIGDNCFAGCTSLTTINYEDPIKIAGINLITILSGNTSQATVNFYLTSSAPDPALENTVYYTQYYTAGTTFNYINGGMPVICLDENTLVCIDLENNYVPIKDIKSGDMVVDYSGNLVPVLFNICSVLFVVLSTFIIIKPNNENNIIKYPHIVPVASPMPPVSSDCFIEVVNILIMHPKMIKHIKSFTVMSTLLLSKNVDTNLFINAIILYYIFFQYR